MSSGVIDEVMLSMPSGAMSIRRAKMTAFGTAFPDRLSTNAGGRNMEGADKIKLTKLDPANDGPHHHFIPLAWVDHVDAHVHLSKTSDDAKAHWEHGTN